MTAGVFVPRGLRAGGERRAFEDAFSWPPLDILSIFTTARPSTPQGVKFLYNVMSCLWRIFLSPLFILSLPLSAQEEHSHSAPEKLGAVSFPISCMPTVQQQFNRGVALLHSFAYAAAESTFREVATQDPQCAMAHWGVAMTHFHQLWEPPLPAATISIANEEILRARAIGADSVRERKFV